ncbi:saccharopine dehydrogenase family protein [Dyella sp.]|uniref:saccharopine dehydrogenase family protein n=1 Tax=Dyella sp. TaxID=1869338 RepID=UPI002ED5202F
MLRVVLIGASGVFGLRIARQLAHDARFELLLTGRRLDALDALRDTLGDPRVLTAALDVQAADFPKALAALAPQLVIHAAGPFQSQDYHVAHAAIACGSDYVDLADARQFVADIGRLDGPAREAGRLVVSGASTLPALSAAAIDHLRDRFSRLDSIEHAISPGNRTPRGDATVAAILNYCGHRVPIWRDGTWTHAYGWLSTRRAPFLSAGSRFVGVCDVPDNVLFPERYRGVRSVTFRAGLELYRLHFGLWTFAWLARWGLIRHLPRHASRLRRMSEWFLRAGSDEGGMVIELRGLGHDGAPLALRWTIHAGAGDGPQIPAMPAVIVARKIADGTLTHKGATPCMGLFDLEEALAALNGFAMTTELETLKA